MSECTETEWVRAQLTECVKDREAAIRQAQVAHDRIKELEAQNTEAMREAERLAKALHRRFYQEQAPQWKPLEYVAGIVSQIDNMTAGMADRIEELEAAIDWQIGRAESVEAKLAKWEEATTPSADTKRAYMGEFTFSIEMYHPRLGSDHRRVSVPWTVIEDIMRAISIRAKGENDD